MPSGVTHLHFPPPPPPRVRSPNNGKVGIKFLCPHSWCFGSYFDVIFLISLASSSFSFKPTSSSSTHLSQERVCRKVVIKHSIKSIHLPGPRQGLVTYLPIPESAVPNEDIKLGIKFILPTLLVLRVLFRCNLFDVSSVFWLSFQTNLMIILIERVCRKMVVKHSINSNLTYGPSTLPLEDTDLCLHYDF